jgi:O-acetyl-ADP-ribose deacetylase
MDRWHLGQATLELVQGDITDADTEAIGNAANSALMRGGGVDGAIHRAAGPKLQEALNELRATLPGNKLPTGKAVLTPGFELRAQYVIHCVGPIYDREGAQAAPLLASAYREALALCQTHGIVSVSFPSISTGIYGYPVREAARVALAASREGLAQAASVRLCRFVLYDPATLVTYREAAEILFTLA